jgi:tRNA A-37 threonylcarbamoyl transferase component Bud32
MVSNLGNVPSRNTSLGVDIEWFANENFSQPYLVKNNKLTLITGKIHFWVKEVKTPKSLRDYLIKIVRQFNSIKVIVPIKNPQNGLIENKIYYFNISEISSKLNINKGLVRKISKNHNALDQLDAIAIIRSGAPIKKVGNDAQLKKELILSVVNLNSGIVTFKVGEGNNSQRFFLNRNGMKKCFYAARKIGTGTYGKVFEVHSRSLGEVPKIVKKIKKKLYSLEGKNTEVKKAYKEPNEDHEAIAKEALLNEYEVLKDLNPNGDAIGIQKAPDSPQNGMYFAYKYEGSLSEINQERFKNLQSFQKLEFCFQLVQGLRRVHDKGYIHGDIKPDNCFFALDERKMPNEFVLADFGGVIKASELLKTLPVGTNEYRPSDYYLAVRERDQEEREKLFRAADVYALSKTIVEVLLGIPFEPFSTHEVEMAEEKIGEKIDQLMVLGLSEEIAEVLVSGLNDVEMRPTLEEFSQQLQDAMRNQKNLGMP